MEENSALGMPNHSSLKAFGWEYKDVYPAAVIRTVSGTETLSHEKVNRFPAFPELGERSEMGQKKKKVSVFVTSTPKLKPDRSSLWQRTNEIF